MSMSARNMTLLIAALSSLGPFAIDTYLPAFAAIAQDLQATDLQVQQTLTIYMACYGFMNLWHGAVSDSVGRRRLVSCTLTLFALASLGAATSRNIDELLLWRALQGLVGGAGMIIGRAIIRDVFEGSNAQRQLSKVMMIFALAPVVAPVVGAGVYELAGWRAIFVFLACYTVVVALLLWRFLPETLPVERRQSLRPANLLSGYRQIFSMPDFWRTSLALSLLFQGFFLYIMAAPVFGRVHLGLEPTGFVWIFLPGVAGTVLGSAISARTAGRLGGGSAIGIGLLIMVSAALLNLSLNWQHTPALPWAVVHLAIYNLGLGLAISALQVRLLDLAPQRRGMVASCHASLQSGSIAVTAGVVAPFLWGSTRHLALGMLAYIGVAALLYAGQLRARTVTAVRTAP